MQYYFLWLIAIPFLWINYKIIKSDLKQKKIPNKLLWYLILMSPFFYFYNFYYSDINYLFFFFSIFLTFIISFILYYFWIWAAWDAKYLLVLWLFLVNVWIIPFVWNIALITIIYLLLYFLWFYFWKCIFIKWYSRSLWWNIYNDLKDKSTNFLKHWDWNFYKKIIFLKIIKLILLFLVIFVSIRLARLYIFADIKWNIYYHYLINYLQDYSYYMIFAIIWIFIWLIYLVRFLVNKLKLFLSNTSRIENNFIIDFILIWILSIALISFIIYEYFINPGEIKSYLIKIFTIYILFYILFRVLKYAYKITFQIWEQDIINIKDLKEWSIVDRDYLIKMFWEQSSLWANWNKWILSPNPKEYFSEIENPIDIKTRNKLIKIYKIVNNYHLKETWTAENNSIKILKTFAFGWYIFSWFIISFLFWNIPSEIIILNIIKIFNIHF
jgi:hypothetical protein